MIKKFLIFNLSLLVLVCHSFAQKKFRILTAGIRHESNTFTTLKTKEHNFKVLYGEEALKNQPWAEELKKHNVEIIPTLHAYAWPGGVVEKAPYEKFKNYIIEEIKKAGKLDGIYLDMHGALHVEGYEDAQLSFIKEIRSIVGNNVIISGSFDLHGNLSRDFVKHLNILTAFRTAPHRDADSTRVRAVRLLMKALENNYKPVIAHVNIPIIIPGEKGITSVEPWKTLYEKLPLISQKEGLMDASIFIGFAFSDLPRTSMSAQVVAQSPEYYELAKKELKQLATEIWQKRFEFNFDVENGYADEVIVKALKSNVSPVFICDSGDNTTGGAAGDSPFMLQKLIEHNVKNAVVAGIFDSMAVAICEKAGVGNTVELSIGGKIDNLNFSPFKTKAKVLYLTPAEYYNTNHRAAVVDIEGITVVLQAVRRSFTEPDDFKYVNINPADYKIIVVKLGYLYPKLRDYAPREILAITPGFCNVDTENYPYKYVTRPAFPLDKNFNWEPKIE